MKRRDLSRVFMANGCADTYWHSVFEFPRFRVPAFDVDDSDTPWHPQFDEFQFLSQFSAALALGAFVQLCRSIGTHCSRGTSSHTLSCFRISRRTSLCIEKLLNILSALFLQRNTSVLYWPTCSSTSSAPILSTQLPQAWHPMGVVPVYH